MSTQLPLPHFHKKWAKLSRLVTLCMIREECEEVIEQFHHGFSGKRNNDACVIFIMALNT